MNTQPPPNALPVESRLFFGCELADFIEKQNKANYQVLTRWIKKVGISDLYEFQRVPMSETRQLT